MATSPYDTDLERNPANFQPLTPLTFQRAPDLSRSSAIIHCHAPVFANLRQRAACFGFGQRAIKRGDTVSVCSPTRAC